jgi:hypothetical protein
MDTRLLYQMTLTSYFRYPSFSPDLSEKEIDSIKDLANLLAQPIENSRLDAIDRSRAEAKIASYVVDTMAVSLLDSWITSLSSCPP